MTSKIDVVRAYYDLAWTNPPASIIEAAEAYISDDFKSFDENGNVVMTKEVFIGMSHLLLGAFKDLKVVYNDLREEGDGVLSTFHFEGTHTGEFDLSAMGLGVIPASGKKIVWPDAKTKWNVKDGKIVSEEPISAGMGWFLTPLGIKLPTA